MEELNDGKFWMDLNTYVDTFYQTIICHWQPTYDYFAFADTHSTLGHGVARIVFAQDIKKKIVFQLHQTHRRFLNNNFSSTFEYAPLQMYLARVIRVDPDNIKPRKKAN